MAAGGPDRRVIGVAVAIPVAILIALGAAGLLGGDDDDGTATSPTTSPSTTAPAAVDEAWDELVADTFQPLAGVLPNYARTVDEWSNGDRTDAELTATLDEVEPVVQQVAARAAVMPPHRRDELAGVLARDAADLYVQAVSAHRQAASAGDEAVSRQWDRLGRRLRILGDRTFDRARDRTRPPVDAGDGVDLRLPAEVPDFDRLELAVGPPLEPTDTDVVDAAPRLREEERPSQPAEAWAAAVRDLDAPTADDVAGASDDPEAAGAVARRLVDAAEALRAEAVPDGDRGRADRLALGWLVLADAARAAQLAALSGEGSGVATALLDVAGSPAYAAA